MEKIGPRRPGDFEKIQRAKVKIVELLDHHHIKLSNPDYLFAVVMQGATDGKVHAALAQAIGTAVQPH